MINQDHVKALKSYTAQLLAIEMLEYHNKNLLAGDNKSRCETKMEILGLMTDLLLDIDDNPV